MPEITLGISVADGGAQLRRLGLREGFLRELLLAGEAVSADVAHREGLVDHLFPDEASTTHASPGRVAWPGTADRRSWP